MQLLYAKVMFVLVWPGLLNDVGFTNAAGPSIEQFEAPVFLPATVKFSAVRVVLFLAVVINPFT